MVGGVDPSKDPAEEMKKAMTIRAGGGSAHARVDATTLTFEN